MNGNEWLKYCVYASRSPPHRAPHRAPHIARSRLPLIFYWISSIGVHSKIVCLLRVDGCMRRFSGRSRSIGCVCDRSGFFHIGKIGQAAIFQFFARLSTRFGACFGRFCFLQTSNLVDPIVELTAANSPWLPTHTHTHTHDWPICGANERLHAKQSIPKSCEVYGVQKHAQKKKWARLCKSHNGPSEKIAVSLFALSLLWTCCALLDS